MTLPRSIAIPKNWKTFNFASFFSAIGYPVLGVALFVTMVLLGIFLSHLTFHWWYLLIAFAVTAFTIFVCNAGIGPLHRILQHRAGELAVPGQVLTMINLVIAMQGNVKDWVNYHSQHHRFSDAPGDHGRGPHAQADCDRVQNRDDRFGQADCGDCFGTEPSHEKDIDDGEYGFHRHLEHHRYCEKNDGAANRNSRVVVLDSSHGVAEEHAETFVLGYAIGVGAKAQSFLVSHEALLQGPNRTTAALETKVPLRDSACRQAVFLR